MEVGRPFYDSTGRRQRSRVSGVIVTNTGSVTGQVSVACDLDDGRETMV